MMGRKEDIHYCVFTTAQLGAILYAAEDMGSEYLSEDDPGIAWMGEILIDLIPLIKAALP